MSVAAIVVQAVVGVATVIISAGASYTAARRGARETETRSRREEWWRRFVWAADARGDAGSEARRSAGEAVLAHLYGSELVGADERDILLRVQFAAQARETERQGSTSGDQGGHH